MNTRPIQNSTTGGHRSGLSSRGIWIATWGVLGVLLLLTQAIWRLGERALEAFQLGLNGAQWSVLVLWTLFSVYGEGYRAFQKRFSPRVVVRAWHLAQNPTPARVVLAPAYCMALFHASKRTRTVAWATLAMVICLVLVIRHVPQPWRGIIDAGVVVALLWGAIAIVVFYARALHGAHSGFPPGLPESKKSATDKGIFSHSVETATGNPIN